MEIKYNISLKHDDFVLLLEVLKKAQKTKIVTWDATSFICENTKIEELI